MRREHSFTPPWRLARPTRSQPTLVAVLLLFAVSLAAALAYQAQAAARSHREAAESALHDYASFAMWELTQDATRELLGAMIPTFIAAQVRIDPARPDEWPTVVELKGALDARNVPVPYLAGVGHYFRLDWRDTTITTLGTQPSAETLAWIRRAVTTLPSEVEDSTTFKPLLWQLPGQRSPRYLQVVFSNDSYVATFRRVAGRSRVLVFALSRDLDGRPLVTYGIESDARSFVAPILGEILAHSPLLPPSLVRGLPSDSILSVRVRAPGGAIVFQAGGAPAGAYAETDTLDARFGNLVFELSLRPDVAPRLVVGGLPRSRFPMLIGLLTLTVALIGVALLQVRRQEELSRLRTGFVSGVSHELRTPLAQIRLFAELIRDGGMRSDAERRRSAEIIDEEARRLTILIDNVLSFSRAEHGANRVTPRPLQLGEEVRQAVDAFAPLARARRATLRVGVGGELRVLADPGALRQMMLNLLDNAVKYTPPGRTVTVGMAGLGGRARFWVDDEGPGVPPAERERIWEPYVRLARGIDAPVGGTGIGLAIVRELAVLNGGWAWVQSAPSGGARFIVELPRIVDERAAPEAGERAHVGGGA